MNFLLHRHFAQVELESRHAGVGAMLPDLWRMASRQMRVQPHAAPPPAAREVHAGVRHHLDADVWFHRTRVFREGERSLARDLLQVGARKLVLFAHPAWEMCLDGAWLGNQATFDTHLSALRADLDDAYPHCDALATTHGANNLTDVVEFGERMTRLRRGLHDGRWLDSYRTGHGLTDCINGIRQRLNIASLTETEQSITACILEEALERAAEALPELIHDRERHNRCAG